MIDLKLLREQPDLVRASQAARGEDVTLVDQALAAEARRRASLLDFENLRAEQKAAGKQVAQAKGDEKQALLARTKELAASVKQAQVAAGQAEAELDALAYAIPNLVEGAPAGGADDYLVVKQVGVPRDFRAEGFEPADHLAIGEALGAIDTVRGAKVSGARFHFLTGVGARLELAILNAAMDVALRHGFTPVITPTLVKPETMRGTGFLGEHADEVYHLEKDDLYLV
ncbi:MAG: serine--tRNA ligase, partial [Promicromonosporaceae bacterium]|nr:serine--tRNA ligase [Promicromonosporaceae bacterium]